MCRQISEVHNLVVIDFRLLAHALQLLHRGEQLQRTFLILAQLQDGVAIVLILQKGDHSSLRVMVSVYLIPAFYFVA